MQFVHVEPSRIEAHWPVIAEILAPAVRVHAGAKMQDVFDRLMSGHFHLLECSGEEGSGLLVIHVFAEGELVSCYASYIAGQTSNRRRLIPTMRSIMTQFETHCRAAGVHQIYIGGRDWSRVFPDFSPADDVPGRLRKVL
jgi:hypothetical protein